MRLLRLHAEGFGALQDYRLELADGLNVLHQKNGWGKSTLAVFIKAMLYGLPASTKKSLDENERKKYAPWQGGVFGGSLEFECQRGSFRVERFFGEKESGDSFALFDLQTNKPSDAFGECIGEELFGIDADGFERSTYLSQRAKYEKSENTSIRTKLGDLLDDVNDMGNYDTAMELLDKRRKFYQMTGNRGAIAQEEKRLADLRAELEVCLRAEAIADEKRAACKTCNEAIAEAEAQEKALAAKRELVMRARERMAQEEEKGRMLSELSALSDQRKLAEEELCGIIPSEEEIAAAQGLLFDIHNLDAVLESIPTVSPDAEEMQSMRELFAEGVPSTEEMESCRTANDRLIRLREKQAQMRTELEGIPMDVRFSAGIPTPEDLEHQHALLAESERIGVTLLHEEEARIRRREAAIKQKRTWRLSGILGAIVGVACVGVSFLFSGAMLVLLLAVGGVIALLGGGAILLSARRGAEEADGTEEKKRMREQSIATVMHFLQKYGMPTDGDLSRALNELSVLAVQNREKGRRRRILRDQLTETGLAAERMARKIGDYLCRFDAHCTEECFGQTLTELRRDVERYRMLVREDMRRTEQRRAAQKERAELNARLQPFIKRYDPMGVRDPEETVADVSASANAYRQFTREYKRRELALRTFISEKQLDRPIADGEINPSELAAEEDAVRLQLEELRGQRTRLNMEIERLADDTDRIPELEGEIASTEERARIYTQNHKTITAAQKLLTEAKEGLSTRYLGGMQERFLHYLSELTEGEVTESVLDSSFDVSVRAYGKSRSMESLSRGMRDAVRFCVRLSLTEELAKESETPFLLLDDPFVNLDEEHLQAVQGLLRKLSEQYQIIHMICHEGRA